MNSALLNLCDALHYRFTSDAEATRVAFFALLALILLLAILVSWRQNRSAFERYEKMMQEAARRATLEKEIDLLKQSTNSMSSSRGSLASSRDEHRDEVQELQRPRTEAFPSRFARERPHNLTGRVLNFDE